MRYAAILTVLALGAASCQTPAGRETQTGADSVLHRENAVSFGPLPPEFRVEPERVESKETPRERSPAGDSGEMIISLKDLEPAAPSRLSLNLDKAPIESVFEILGDVSGVNFVVHPSASGTQSPSMTLVDVTWMEALEMVLNVNGLAAVVNNRSVFDATGRPADIGPKDVVIVTTYENLLEEQEKRKKAAANSVELEKRRRRAAEEKYRGALLMRRVDKATRSYRFKYADPVEAVEYLKALYNSSDDLPVVDGTGRADAARTGKRSRAGKKWEGGRPAPLYGRDDAKFAVFRSENLVTVTAPAPRMAEIMSRIKEIDVRPRQVYIEARIVEIQRNHIKDLGIQWGGHAARTTELFFPNTMGAQGAQGEGNVVSLPPESMTDSITGDVLANAAGGALGVTLGDAAGSAVIMARLFALERAGVSRTLSNPKVAAINGESASIKSGREIPYQSTSANTGTRIEFKEAVISLQVTPQILEDNRIRMKIRAKKDEVDRELSVQGTPAIKKKELTTSVVVGNGGSAVLGGLFEGERGNFENRVPWFHKIPVLGRLFKNDRKVNNELELLVFITPTIIEQETVAK